MQPEKGRYFFTSESVTEGHPDKVADQISDAILDTLIEQDPDSRVACETLVTTGMAVIAGEISTKGYACLLYTSVWHIEVPEELPFEALKPYGSIGLTAGASTPERFKGP